MMIMVILWAAGDSRSAFERQPESTRSCAMGGAGAATPGNVWGGLMNPAGLAGVTGRTVALSVAPSPFGLQELRRASCAFAEPLGRFTVSLTALRYGYDLYHEVTVGASCGCDFGGGVRGGATVTLNSLSIAGYGSGSCVGIDAGVLWEIVHGLRLGASAINCNSPSPGRSGEGIPRSFVAEIAYAPLSGMEVACDIAEDPRFPAEIRLGGEYFLAGHVFLRAGISSDPSAIAAGIGILLLPVEIDYAFSRHQELGFTHRFGITLRMGDS